VADLDRKPRGGQRWKQKLGFQWWIYKPRQRLLFPPLSAARNLLFLAYPLRERATREEREQGNDGGEEQREGELGCEQEGGVMQELWAEILQVVLRCGIWEAIGEGSRISG
jgi:hypothetical protein